MKNKITQTVLRSFFALVALLAAGLCIKETSLITVIPVQHNQRQFSNISNASSVRAVTKRNTGEHWPKYKAKHGNTAKVHRYTPKH